MIVRSARLQYQLKGGGMCYIKKQELGDVPVYERCGNNCQCSTILQSHNSAMFPFFNAPFIWNNPISQNACTLNKLHQQIQLIQNFINSNNQLIQGSFEKLEKNQNQLITLHQQIDDILNQGSIKVSAQDEEVQKYVQDTTTFPSNSYLIQKLFGHKNYRFKIKPTSELPKTIYKERNLHISLQLVTKQGKLVKNANLFHLCIAVCDQQGKWIVDQNDQFFIQGKIEVDLYRGECEFKKIYPKDISRHFPGGKVNIIIYPKPSILIPTQPLNQAQYHIDCDQIEPLLFSNILIKAKKKRRY